MTPPEVRVDISHGPADAAQLSAWTWLWRRLLAPENSDASEGVTPEASERGTPGPRTLEIVDVPKAYQIVAPPVNRKTSLVALGQWALSAGRWSLVWAVTVAIQREGMRHG